MDVVVCKVPKTSSSIIKKMKLRDKTIMFVMDNFREFLAELGGTFILLMFGIGSIAQTVLGKGKFGGILSINFGWGIGIMMGLYWSAGISGGHLNPAVTLAMSITKRLPWRKLPVYWLAQSIGAFIASAIVYGIYFDLLNALDGGVRNVDTAFIWTTRPAKGVSTVTTFFDQLVSSTLLVGLIFALTDKRNAGPSPQVLPLCIGLIVFGIGLAFGINCGYGINPARNLIPRIFTAIAGWKVEALSYQNYYFWAPILAQLLGGVLGAFAYIISIEIHHTTSLDGHTALQERRDTLPVDNRF